MQIILAFILHFRNQSMTEQSAYDLKRKCHCGKMLTMNTLKINVWRRGWPNFERG